VDARIKMLNIGIVPDIWKTLVSDSHRVTILIALVVGLGTLHFLRGVYRRHFHPLCQFSGPPEAASSTSWLYKISKAGFPETEFEKLHKRYRMASHMNNYPTETGPAPY
jgi:hypothetical protein